MRPYWWLGVIALLFIAFLGNRGLNEPDEGRYAEIAREMAAGGDWLIPHLNGFPHFQKPPVMYWATASAITVLGVNEWAVRLVPALAGFGIVLMTFFVGRRLFGETAGRNAALILASSLEFFLMARSLTPDMLMAFFIVLAIASFVFRRNWLFFVAMGLGFMTKGPMALVVPLAAAICWEIAARGKPEARKLPWVRGMLITLAIATSWFIVISLRDKSLVDYFLKYELVERFASKTHGRSQPFWFYLPVLLLGLFPWSLLGLRVLRKGWLWVRTHPLAPHHIFLAGWIVIPFLILTCSGSKLVTYVLPLLPAFAIVLGVGFARVNSRMLLWAVPPTMILWLAIAAYAPFFESKLGRQTSVRYLARVAESHPDAVGARFFTSGARVHGMEFYLKRLVTTTKADADIVLPLDVEESARVFKNSKALAKEFTRGKKEPAIGITEKELYGPVFKVDEWHEIAASGDFLLISNAPARQGAVVTP